MALIITHGQHLNSQPQVVIVMVVIGIVVMVIGIAVIVMGVVVVVMVVLLLVVVSVMYFQDLTLSRIHFSNNYTKTIN